MEAIIGSPCGSPATRDDRKRLVIPLVIADQKAVVGFHPAVKRVFEGRATVYRSSVHQYEATIFKGKAKLHAFSSQFRTQKSQIRKKSAAAPHVGG